MSGALADPAAQAPPGNIPVRPIWHRRAVGALLVLSAALLLVRLATLGTYPLMDTSEARYGEIARVMLATGNFITPQEIAGTPFWAKPPLYAWMSVLSMQLLGVNEFALRLPSFLCALGVLALCARWARGLAGAAGRDERATAAVLSTTLLCSSVLFFVSAGAVMTDPALALCTTGMLVCFHEVAIRGCASRGWRWGLFAFAGFAMLAKGPVVLLYAGAPIVIWTLWQRRLAAVWSAFPWAWGTALAAAICVPWYVAAELRTPGFLQYFLLGEHVMRFLRPGWGGDLYGTAHAEPPGTIWLYLGAAMGLGTALVLAAAAAPMQMLARGRFRTIRIAPENALPVLAVAAPMALFSFAGNIIWTYVLPVLGPLAVLASGALAPRLLLPVRAWRTAVLAVLAAAGLTVSVAALTWLPRHVARHSSAALLAQWRQRGAIPGMLVYWGQKAPASLRFYSRGLVRAVPDLAQALQGVDREHDRYLALAPPRLEELQRYVMSAGLRLALEPLARNEDLAVIWVHGATGR